MLDPHRLRRPEYTGENRCRACTVVNVAILAVTIVVVGLRMPLLAVGVGVVGAAAIVFRGYLVPFTPRVAPALVARLPGEFFADAGPTASDRLSDVAAESTDPEAVLRTLTEEGVVIVDGDQLRLDTAFESAWRERMDALADSKADRLAAAARDSIPEVASARVEATGSETFLVATGEAGSSGWIRRPVVLAKVAAAEALGEADIPATQRAVAASALCAFLETCPACGGDVVEGNLDDCCGHSLGGASRDSLHGLTCETCGVVFHRFE